MERKGTLIIILLFINMLFPLLLIFNVNVSASWLGDSQPLTKLYDNNLDYSNPSLDINSTGVIFFSYTWHVYENDDHEIYIGDTSSGKDRSSIIFDLDDIELTEGDGSIDPILNTSDNAESELRIDNDIIHVVWQGVPYLAGDSEIIYTNSSNYANVLQVSDTTNDNDYYPTIAVVNNTVFIAHNNGGTDIAISSTLGGWNNLFSPIDPHGTRNGTIPKLSSWSNSTYWRIDLAYDNDLGGITYQWLESTDTALSDIGSNIKNIGTGGTITDLAIDSNQHMAAIAYVNNSDIFVLNTSDASPIAKRITDNTLEEGDPDVLISENDVITVLFGRNITSTQSLIVSTDNYGSSFSNIDHIITKEQVPLSGSQLQISSFDAALVPGEAVILIYEAIVPDNVEDEQKLYLSAYGNLYNNGGGEFNYYFWEETLADIVYSEGWVIEGFEISYNTSSGADVDLKIRLTDLTTNETWYNISSYQFSGGNYEKKLFFQPGNYFIARNPFIVEVLNGSNSQDLVKVELDPLEFPFNEFNYSSNYDNGTFAYTIQDENIGTGLEFTVFYFDVNNEMRNRVGTAPNYLESTKNQDSASGTINSENYVDLFKFDMMAGEQYNMSLTVTGAGENDCRLLIFDNTAQITSPSNALYSPIYINSSTNGEYFQLYSPTDSKYYVIIENLDYTQSYTYDFEFKPCPMVASISMSNLNTNNFVISDQVNFQWDINTKENLGEPDLNIDHYDLKVYSIDDLVNAEISKTGVTEKNTTEFVIGKDEYDLDDGTYYMNVTIVTDDNQISHPSILEFYIDTQPPQSPDIAEPPSDFYFSRGQFWVNWSIPSDGAFYVHHYELYRGDSENFPCDSAHRLGPDYTGNTTYQYVEDESKIHYFKVIAVDYVGLKSNPSKVGKFVVSYGAFVDPKGQNFAVLPGDFLEYQFVDIIDENIAEPSRLKTDFMGKTFYINTELLFYVTTATNQQAIPTIGTWYRKWVNTTAQQLNIEYEELGTGRDMTPLVTTSDKDYQRNIVELYILREFNFDSLAEVQENFNYHQKTSLYFEWFKTIEVVVHTYYKAIDYDQQELGDINFLYDSLIFVYDAKTGVLIEMTLYNYKEDKGFSLRLINTNIGLSELPWWLIPLIIGAALGVIVAIINQIVKKLERRV